MGCATPGKVLRKRVFQILIGIKEICGTAIIRHQNNTKLRARRNSVLATLNGISTCIVGFGNNLQNAEVDCLSRRLIKQHRLQSYIHIPLTRRPWGLGIYFFLGFNFFQGSPPWLHVCILVARPTLFECRPNILVASTARLESRPTILVAISPIF